MSPATVRPVDPYSLTREQRRDRDAMRGGCRTAAITCGWEPILLGFYTSAPEQIERTCVELEAIGGGLNMAAQDPAAIKRFARKLGGPADLLLRLVNALSDIWIQDRGKAADILLRLL